MRIGHDRRRQGAGSPDAEPMLQRPAILAAPFRVEYRNTNARRGQARVEVAVDEPALDEIRLEVVNDLANPPDQAEVQLVTLVADEHLNAAAIQLRQARVVRGQGVDRDLVAATRELAAQRD